MPLISTLDYLEISDLERQILSTSSRQNKDLWEYSRATGGYHGQVNHQNRDLLRRWLVGVGGNPAKVRTASDRVLGNAFKVGERYIEQFNEPDRLNKKQDRNVGRYSPKIELDLDQLEIPQGFGGGRQRVESWGDLDSDKGKIPTPPAPYMNEDAIARAAEAIIGKKINDGLTQLTNQVAGVVKQAVGREIGQKQNELWDALSGLADDLRSSIRGEITTLAESMAEDVATRVARQMIEENLPRKLEIKINGHDPKILDAEPRHKIFDECLKWLAVGEHVYLVGGAGTGKTFLFKQLAKALGKRFLPVGQALTKYDVSGFKGPTGEYIPTIIRDAVENGGLLCIDEGDMWAAAALGFLNTALANDFVAFPDAVVPVHSDFQCIIAANTYGRGANQLFVGRNPLDGATLDRFAYVICDYDNNLEIQLNGTSPWIEYVQRVRAAVESLKLPHIVSMRATKRCIAGANAGFDPDQIAFSALWRGLDPDTVKRIKSIAGEPPRPTLPKIDIETPEFDFGEDDDDGYNSRDFFEWQTAMRNNKKIDAIKVFRKYPDPINYTIGLKNAKDWVEQIEWRWEEISLSDFLEAREDLKEIQL